MSELNIGGSNMTVELRDEDNTLYAAAKTGNKQWVAILTDTHPKYNFEREFVAYQKPKTSNRDSGTETVEEGAVIERVRYTHSGKNRKDRFYQLVDGEAHQIDEIDVEAAIDGEIIPDIEEKTHECEECGDEFDSGHGLAIHKGMVHKDDEETGQMDEQTAATADDGQSPRQLVADGGTAPQTPTEAEFPMDGGVETIYEMTDESETPVGGVDYVSNHPFPHFWISHQDAGQRWVYVVIDRDDSVMPDHDSWEAFLNSDRNPVGEPLEVGTLVVEHLPKDGGMYIEERHHLDGETVVVSGETAEEMAIRLLHEMAGSADDDSDIAPDGGQEIREYRGDVEFSDDQVRQYSADGTLYAYREGDDHVVVSRGRAPATKWTDRAPAERTAVVSGEQLWTIPDNWDKRITIKGAGASRYAIYHIPESGVDVLATVPHKNHLVDAWYGVKRVGELTVSYADGIAWDELESLIDNIREIEEVSDDVVAALKTLHRRQRSFERAFADGVDMYAEEALFERAHEPVSMERWTTDPWGDIFRVKSLVQEFLDVDDETRAGVLRELSEAGIVPSYPTVEVDVEDHEALPEGYDLQALTEAGCTPSEAIDYKMTEIGGQTQTAWARTRGKDPSTVSGNVNQAERILVS